MDCLVDLWRHRWRQNARQWWNRKSRHRPPLPIILFWDLFLQNPPGFRAVQKRSVPLRALDSATKFLSLTPRRGIMHLQGIHTGRCSMFLSFWISKSLARLIIRPCAKTFIWGQKVIATFWCLKREDHVHQKKIASFWENLEIYLLHNQDHFVQKPWFHLKFGNNWGFLPFSFNFELAFCFSHQGALGDLYRSMAPLQKELTAPVPNPYLTSPASLPVPSIGKTRSVLGFPATICLTQQKFVQKLNWTDYFLIFTEGEHMQNCFLSVQEAAEEVESLGGPTVLVQTAKSWSDWVQQLLIWERRTPTAVTYPAVEKFTIRCVTIGLWNSNFSFWKTQASSALHSPEMFSLFTFAIGDCFRCLVWNRNCSRYLIWRLTFAGTLESAHSSATGCFAENVSCVPMSFNVTCALTLAKSVSRVPLATSASCAATISRSTSKLTRIKTRRNRKAAVRVNSAKVTVLPSEALKPLSVRLIHTTTADPAQRNNSCCCFQYLGSSFVHVGMFFMCFCWRLRAMLFFFAFLRWSCAEEWHFY